MSKGKRLFFTVLILISFFVFQSNLSAADNEVDTLTDPLVDFKVNKDEILKSLDVLKKDGKISDKDYEEAKKQLLNMNDGQINGLKDKAINMVRKDPDKTVDLYKDKKIDLKKVEQHMKESQPQ